MIPTERFEQVEVASLEELRAWLAAHHGQEESVWLVRYRKTVPAKFVDRLAVLDELLCFGWVDGLARKLDERRTMQLISPRRQQAWAQTYKDRAARLEAEGRMQAPGRAAIERSKRLGLWDAYAEVDLLSVPDDLRAVLRAVPQAEVWFDAAAPSYRRNVLRWIAAAKRAETRAARVARTVELSAEGRKVPQM
ncbi:YdeI family protein [Roseomonas sp. CCTCC AB2023176]|uniref:YdeI/OmpD-associated family protein n=1 Tax=Roseomonas sp. CCTCC AB2023176 TaxID=3342640 RepID=UPI0035D8853F